jgi:hypothetical protein
MTTPAIPAILAPAATPPATQPKPVQAEGAPVSPSRAAQKDEAVISKDGKDALATNGKSQAAEAAPSKVLSNSDAALIGQGLKRSNPEHFKQYDTNGDGKLNAQEAKAAGLG